MAGGICLVVHLADKLALCEDDGGPSMFEISVWPLMPQDLLDRILLFLPASSQARLRCVCKRWSRLVTSSAFRKESDLIAFRRSHRNFVCCKLELALANEAGNNGSGEALHKVDMPGATTSLPGLDINSSSLKVFCGAGLVGMAHLSDEGTLDCWLLNPTNRACRRLPRLFLESGPFKTMQRCRWGPDVWQIWLEPAPECRGSSDTLNSFHVVLLAFHPCAVDTNGSSSAALYTYSSASTCTGWRTVHHPIPRNMWRLPCAVTKGGYVSWFRDIGWARMSWDSDRIMHLSDPPSGVFQVISDPGTAAVFGFGWNSGDKPAVGLSLYRLDESSGWRCLYSGLPPQLHPTRIHVHATKILGNMLILVCSIWEYYPELSRERHAMAYHMHDGSCQWFRLPAQAFLFDDTAVHKSVVLEPMLVSHLRL